MLTRRGGPQAAVLHPLQSVTDHVRGAPGLAGAARRTTVEPTDADGRAMARAGTDDTGGTDITDGTDIDEAARSSLAATDPGWTWPPFLPVEDLGTERYNTESWAPASCVRHPWLR